MDTDEDVWLDADQQAVWRAFLRAHTRLNIALARDLQASSELSLPDFEVLVHLTDDPQGRLRITELATGMQWERSRLSHHVTRMERRGLVERRGCASDGRGAFVLLTDRGRAAIEDAAPSHVRTVRRLVFADLDAEELVVFGRVLAKVTAAADDELGGVVCEPPACPA